MNYLFPILAAVIWGGNTVVSKLSAGVLTPIEISFYRWLLAVLVLTPFVLKPVLSNKAINSMALLRFAVLGILGGVIYQSLSYYAAHFTSAISMGIILTLVPVVAQALSTMFFGHRPNGYSMVALVISMLGVILVVTNGNPSSLAQRGLNFGDALMLLAVMAFAIYSVMLGRWKDGVPILQSVYLQAVFASLTFLPFFIFSVKHPLQPIAGFYVAFAGIGASIFAPLLWMLGVIRLGAARVSLFFNLVPVVTALLATVFLTEMLTRWVLIGGGLGILGVVIAEAITVKAPA